MNVADRHISHFDLDAFFVEVERLKNSRLKGKPLLVGGLGDRGVVAACSYEARKFGIYSAMPMRMARKMCPEAIILSGDMESYSQYSRAVTDIIAEGAPLYERSSIDEFYIDLTGMDRFHDCYGFSSELREKVSRETGLSISFGLASNKLVSKVATNEVKPNGTIQIPHGQEKTFIAPLGVEKLPGIGRQKATLLYQMGVETIRTLSLVPPEGLFRLFGRDGVELSNRAKGVDETPIVPYREQKSISTERTFQTDTINLEFLHGVLVRMTEEIAFELRKQNKLTGCVTVKLRYSNFDTVTRQSVIPYTAADDVLLKVARGLFDRLFERRMLVRLVGIRFTHLIPGNYQINLFEDAQQTIRLYQAIDSIKYRFGPQYLRRAKALIKTS